MPAAKEGSKKIPGFSQGVRVNSAVRMMKLVAPICPNSQRKRNADGTFVEVGQNCQLAGGQWWVMCEAEGHDPYFSERTVYETVDVLDDEGFVVGTKKKPIKMRRPNIVQVPIGRRHHSGEGVVLSMKNKGRRRLADFGYEEVCQFRNCQKPVNPKAKSPAFGHYCSIEHLGLIAADAQEILLTQMAPNLDGGTGQSARKRQRQLREALTVAQVEGI